MAADGGAGYADIASPRETDPALTDGADDDPRRHWPRRPHPAVERFDNRYALNEQDRQPRGELQRAAPQVHTGFGPPAELRSAWRARRAARAEARTAARLDGARHWLMDHRPALSAAHGLWPWQAKTLRALVVLVLAGVLLAPAPTLVALVGTLSIFFASIVALRLAFVVVAAIAGGPLGLASAQAATPPDGDQWPPYSVLVPVFDEANVVPDLIAAMADLDYPANRLDILFICEADDTATMEALTASTLPPHMRVIAVPPAEPRTKPKAMNFALAEARGEYFVIFNAEDRPEPDQLKRAVRTFAIAPRDTGCLQARLAYYNPRDNWLTRMFTLEYAMWFELLLPGLRAFHMPIPLGGTSIHMRTDVIRGLGGWDPHNVTEDADLGIRLARHGLRCALLDSTTYEEANSHLGNWICQRTRWIKGYMQTYAVHMRRPGVLWGDLGTQGFVGFQLTFLASIVSGLAHPILWIVFVSWLAGAAPFGTLLPSGLGVLNAGLLVIGAGIMVFAAMAAAARQGRFNLIFWAPFLILYWPLASIAAYRAATHFQAKPFLWEKIRHGLSGRVALPGVFAPGGVRRTIKPGHPRQLANVAWPKHDPPPDSAPAITEQPLRRALPQAAE